VSPPTRHRPVPTPPASPPARNLYGRLWRWHFFAALIVIPFVLWQSVTGTLYLWSEWWMDATHPELRFVRPQREPLPVSMQIGAALKFAAVTAGMAAPPSAAAAAAASAAAPPSAAAASTATPPPAGAPPEQGPDQHSPTAPTTQAPLAAPPSNHEGHEHHQQGHHSTAAPPTGLAVERVLLPTDPSRTTAVLLKSSSSALPYPIFVDPYTGTVLGQLSGAAWLPGISRALHGGWPLGESGSWLLELGDGWAIFMLATGLYLWWPRGRGIAALWPRTRAGKRVLLRDLHSCVAAWFAVIFLFFLISALPWTSFWGGTLLRTIETNTGQSSPVGFSPGGASLAQFSNAAQPIEQAVAAARQAGVRGMLDVRLAPWGGAPLFMTNTGVLPSQDRTIVADPAAGAIRGVYTNGDLPVIPRLVALGIHVHQADFGPVNVWLNTAFAASLMWLTVTGVLSWWNRRPAGKVGAPPKVKSGIPTAIRAMVVTACVLMPLFGASVLLIVMAEAVFRSGPVPAEL